MSPDNLYYIVSSVFAVVIGYDVYNWMKGRKILAPEVRLELLKSKINATVMILGLTLFIVSILIHVNILRYSRPIPFSDIDKITLKDFKGYRRPFETLDGEKDFAFITTAITWNKNDDGLELQALFYPSRSYVFNDRIVDRFLLRHELYHFRITEIFARKCRQQLSVVGKLPSDDTISEIVAVQEESVNEMQHRYDHDSYHGYIMKEQRRWEKNVDSLLTLLDNFRTPTVYE
jgi:hypothetical protein